MLRLNCFVATMRSQYEFILHSERQAERINDFFNQDAKRNIARWGQTRTYTMMHAR
ncbi:hypothetical protein BDV39DRAFT_181588 [Aspergillus sergii]|uniref:Uncharacterized protein n=1 Tax=Aspergillus sergii TaxID=1034303 RepID=A0A5N6WSN8_9EURO|nr:hypothetical protein BDV39DRAFT_181588 [Aspergillus sergii]